MDCRSELTALRRPAERGGRLVGAVGPGAGDGNAETGSGDDGEDGCVPRWAAC